MAGAPLEQVVYGLLLDSVDALVLTLLLGAALFCRRSPLSHRFFPLYLSGVLTLGAARIAPWAALSAKSGFFFIFWMAVLVLVLYSFWEERRAKRDTGDGMIAAGVQLYLLTALLLLAALAAWKRPTGMDWKPLNAALAIVLCFYLIYRIEPHRWLPFPAADAGRFFFILAAGLWMIRASMGGCAIYNAVWEGSGSFRMKGKPFALEYARAWRLPRLEKTILEYWYYPAPIGGEEKKPAPPEKLEQFELGMQEAETFRRRLFSIGENGIILVDQLADAVLQFVDAAKNPLEGRPGLEEFRMERERLVEKLSGFHTSGLDGQVFRSFAGKWHGERDGANADCERDAVETFHPTYFIHGEHPLSLIALQSFRMWDRFGWNAVISPKDEKNCRVILGMVYQVEVWNESKIWHRQPKIGAKVDERRLIWITPEAIWLEQAIPGERMEDDRNVVTGFHYKLAEGKLANEGEGFQAVYTRSPENRPPWFRFELDILVE
ncbi:MAG: hypothetical protein AB1656_17620 [Candidatus Omnitrophota bacterium]